MITLEIHLRNCVEKYFFVANEYAFDNGCFIVHEYDEATGQVTTTIFPIENVAYVKTSYDSEDFDYEILAD